MNPTMAKPFEPSETPRLITPAELAQMVRLCRTMRGWSQENLAAEASVTVRTVQRVESGQPSDIQTRRALARAMGAPDIDAFNHPSEFLSLEQYAERARAEEEARKRDYLEVPCRVVDGKSLVDLTARAGALMVTTADGFDPPQGMERPFAEFQDLVRDTGDIAGDLGAADRLDLAGAVDDYVKQFEAAGMKLVAAERDTEHRFGNGAPFTLTVAYIAACPKGHEPRTLWVPKVVRPGF